MKNHSNKIVLIFLIVLALPLHSEIRYVSKTGSAQPPYTSWATASDSIQKCISLSSFGDTIYVGNGTYRERIFMFEGLSLIGLGWDSCIIDTRTITEPTTDFATIIFRNKCSIEGFSIIVREYYSGGGTGIYAVTASDPIYGEIKNNKLSIAGTGIIASDAILTIKNNVFENMTRGIDVGGSTPLVIDSIYNNYMLNIGNFGIITILSSKAIIFDNVIKVNQNVATAIHSLGTSIVFNNILLNSSRGDYGFRGSTAPSEIRNNIAVNFNVGLAVLPMWNTRNNVVTCTPPGGQRNKILF
jgi:hypothetical protein